MTSDLGSRLDENRWHAFLRVIPLAAALLDTDLRYLFVSERWLRDYGLEGRELTGRRHYEVFPELPQRWKEIHARALLGHAASSEEDVFQRADGSELWVRWEVTPWLDSAGRVGGILISSEDITARRQMQKALASYAELQLIAELAPVAIAYCDREQRYRFVNRRYVDRFGLSAERVIGKKIRDVVGESAYLSFASFVERALSGESVQFELQIPYELGTRHMRCSYVPHFDSSGAADSFVAIIEDVTDRVQATQAFEQAKERLALAVDAAEIGTFYCPMPMGRIEWNDTCKRHFWLAPDAEVNFDVFYSRLHAEDREATRLAVNRTVFEGAPYDVEYRTLSPEGHVRWIRAKGRAYFDHLGNATRFDGITIDVSRQRLIAEEREKLLQAAHTARAQAERASTLKDEFLTTLSHELRTPLHAILGWTQLLANQTNHADVATDEGLRVIERNARAQVRLIDDLLDMSRIISGKLLLEVQRIDLADVIRSALDSVTPAAQAKDLRLQVILDSGPTQVRGDPARLLQVIWNLLSNAVKFTPRHGSIQVTLERVNSHVEVTVADTGIGIAPEFLPHVFERFRQADGGIGRRYGGLGLGLAIVRSIIDLHGGNVRVKSPGTDRGAAFSFELPVVPVSESRPVEISDQSNIERQSSATLAPNASILDGIRVLVVDDEADARELMARVLKRAGAQVDTAADAAAALHQIQEQAPDVLISDIGMAGVDGYEFLRRLRESESQTHSRIPAAALTAFARPEDRRRALLAGYQIHIAKPVDPEELIIVVASLTGQIHQTSKS